MWLCIERKEQDLFSIDCINRLFYNCFERMIRQLKRDILIYKYKFYDLSYHILKFCWYLNHMKCIELHFKCKFYIRLNMVYIIWLHFHK